MYAYKLVYIYSHTHTHTHTHRRDNVHDIKQRDKAWIATIETRGADLRERTGNEAMRFQQQKQEHMKLRFERERLKEENVQRNLARVNRQARFQREEWENKIIADMQKAYRVEAARELVTEAKKQHDIDTFRKAALFRKKFAELSTHGKLEDVIKLAAQLRTKEEVEAAELDAKRALNE
jgi:folylpolyglutamate synthase/dihydropteroate synthase